MARVPYLTGSRPRTLLVVLPTWVGDFVMATPMLRAVRERFRDTRITFLMEPNLRELVAGGDWMDESIVWPAKTERSLLHRAYRDVVRELRRRRFDWAVLLPNSFRWALLARIVGAKRRIGYDREGRGFLLTDRIPCRNRRKRRSDGATERRREGGDELKARAASTQDGNRAAPLRSRYGTESPPGGHDAASSAPPPLKRWGTPPLRYGTESSLAGGDPGSSAPPPLKRWATPPQPVRMGTRLPVRLGPFAPMPLVEYYADLAEAIGCPRPGDRLELFTTPECDEAVEKRLEALDIAHDHPLVVLSPGAKYGAAKCWPAERFAAVADLLIAEDGATVVITCGPGEEPIAQRIVCAMTQRAPALIDPLLTLGQLKSLIRRADLLICNDAGPRHFAKAFDVPVATAFGPTHPDWTATSYPAERVVRIDVDCGPCQQRVCPLGHLDCMTGVTVEMVLDASRELLALGSRARAEVVQPRSKRRG